MAYIICKFPREIDTTETLDWRIDNPPQSWGQSVCSNTDSDKIQCYIGITKLIAETGPSYVSCNTYNGESYKGQITTAMKNVLKQGGTPTIPMG